MSTLQKSARDGARAAEISRAAPGGARPADRGRSRPQVRGRPRPPAPLWRVRRSAQPRGDGVGSTRRRRGDAAPRGATRRSAGKSSAEAVAAAPRLRRGESAEAAPADVGISTRRETPAPRVRGRFAATTARTSTGPPRRPDDRDTRRRRIRRDAPRPSHASDDAVQQARRPPALEPDPEGAPAQGARRVPQPHLRILLETPAAGVSARQEHHVLPDQRLQRTVELL